MDGRPFSPHALMREALGFRDRVPWPRRVTIPASPQRARLSTSSASSRSSSLPSSCATASSASSRSTSAPGAAMAGAEIRSVESVSKQVAVAIHQNRLHTSSAQTVREAEALHRAAARSSTPPI